MSVYFTFFLLPYFAIIQIDNFYHDEKGILELAISVSLCGQIFMLIVEIFEITTNGRKKWEYFRSKWNIFDLATPPLYFTFCAFRMVNNPIDRKSDLDRVDRILKTAILCSIAIKLTWY